MQDELGFIDTLFDTFYFFIDTRQCKSRKHVIIRIMQDLQVSQPSRRFLVTTTKALSSSGSFDKQCQTQPHFLKLFVFPDSSVFFKTLKKEKIIIVCNWSLPRMQYDQLTIQVNW